MKRKKLAWSFIILGIVLIGTFFTLMFVVEDKYFCFGDNIYSQEIVKQAQTVADTTSYFIEVFPFDSVEYHEIPACYIYQDGRLRQYSRYNDSTNYFLHDAEGDFCINFNDTNIIKRHYNQAYEIDKFLQKTAFSIDNGDTVPLYAVDGLFWNQFTYMTHGTGYIQVLDLHNEVFDSLLYREEQIVKGVYDVLSYEYYVRPYRIFYTEKGKHNINQDVKKSFDELVKVFDCNKTIHVANLNFNKFLTDSSFLSSNDVYSIADDAFRYGLNAQHFQGIPYNKLSCASNAYIKTFNLIKGTWYYKDNNNNTSHAHTRRDYETNRHESKYYNHNGNNLVDLTQEEKYDWYMNLDSMYKIILTPLEYKRFRYEQSIFANYIFRNCNDETNDKYSEKGKQYKLNPENKMYQYVTMHGDDYDVMYVLTDFHSYNLYCHNESKLKKISNLFEISYVCCFFGGILVLLAGIIILLRRED